ncbi:hypothetical protein GJAV_G00035090 [Gymnothorax javanicus]|nr:hypothetical protein GJAV_G00035090 [Gymnothorax javanicus]
MRNYVGNSPRRRTLNKLTQPVVLSFTKTSMEFQPICIDMEKSPNSDFGKMHLEVSQHPHSLRSVANLVVALQRMKHSYSPRGTEFSDDDLLNIMLEEVFEEHVTRVTSDTARSRRNLFTHTKDTQYSVVDRDQKSLVLTESPLELQAVILQGASMDCKVNLNLSTYISLNFTDSERRPVALKIAGQKKRNLYLSCSKCGSSPVLQLEEVSDQTKMETIDPASDMARFLFLRRDQGFGSTTVESLMHRGWFISTAVESRRRVEMCPEETQSRLTTFTMKKL